MTECQGRAGNDHNGWRNQNRFSNSALEMFTIHSTGKAIAFHKFEHPLQSGFGTRNPNGHFEGKFGRGLEANRDVAMRRL
jgi:hypothetical protein